MVLPCSRPPAPAFASGTWTWPVDGPVIRAFDPPGSPYGSGHRGIDIAAPAGTVVRAPAAGVVTFAGSVGGRLFVTIDHGGGLLSTCSFLSAPPRARRRRRGPGARHRALRAAATSATSSPNVHLGVRLDGAVRRPARLPGCGGIVADLIRLAPIAAVHRAERRFALAPPRMARLCATPSTFPHVDAACFTGAVVLPPLVAGGQDCSPGVAVGAGDRRGGRSSQGDAAHTGFVTDAAQPPYRESWHLDVPLGGPAASSGSRNRSSTARRCDRGRPGLGSSRRTSRPARGSGASSATTDRPSSPAIAETSEATHPDLHGGVRRQRRPDGDGYARRPRRPRARRRRPRRLRIRRRCRSTRMSPRSISTRTSRCGTPRSSSTRSAARASPSTATPRTSATTPARCRGRRRHGEPYGGPRMPAGSSPTAIAVPTDIVSRPSKETGRRGRTWSRSMRPDGSIDLGRRDRAAEAAVRFVTGDLG